MHEQQVLVGNNSNNKIAKDDDHSFYIQGHHPAVDATKLKIAPNSREPSSGENA
jgi:hypothetical protein